MFIASGLVVIFPSIKITSPLGKEKIYFTLLVCSKTEHDAAVLAILSDLLTYS